MKEGDKVRFLDSDGGGTVVRILEDGTVIVSDEDGMEIPVRKGFCVPDEGYSSYMSRKARKKDLKPSRISAESGFMRHERGRTCREVDLHAEALLHSAPSGHPGDILGLQIETVRSELQRYRHCRGMEIVFIHGKGDGTLRRALLEEIARHPFCRCTDAPYSKYGYRGALTVVIGSFGQAPER